MGRRWGKRVNLGWTAATAAGIALVCPIGASAAFAAGEAVVGDGFDSRTVSSRWGVAPLGGGYVTTMDSAFSVQDGLGRIDLPTGASRKAWLPSVAALDTESTVDLSVGRSIAAGNGTYASLATRVNGSDAYLSRTRIGANGQVAVQLSRVSDQGETVVASEQLAPVVLADWEWLRVRTIISGTSPVSLGMKVWKIGTAEPSTWQLQADDASAERIAGPGSVGLYAYESRSSEGRVLQVDNLVTTLGGSLSSPPPPPSAPVAGRGSLPVGSANYPVPDGSVFVAPNGDDRASGALASPLRTLQQAVDVAGWQQTIVLRAGRYNQTVFVANAKSVTIQAYRGEAVWLDGTVPVTNWQPSGGRWTASGWTVEFERAVSTGWGNDETSWWVGPKNPLAGYPRPAVHRWRPAASGSHCQRRHGGNLRRGLRPRPADPR